MATEKKPEVWKVDRFVQWLFNRSKSGREGKFLFFIGAGCSVTSGVPMAAKLVEKWLPQLKQQEKWSDTEYQDWLKKTGYDSENPAASYSPVMKRLHPTREGRQHEIESITSGTDPKFGYSALAQLMSHPNHGKCFNIALTTNFDDLISDALFLYTGTRPFVVVHKSLAEYVRSATSKPTVIKLHGDALIDPKNTVDELVELEEEVDDKLQSVVSDASAVAFLGYGGNDMGIAKSLAKVSDTSLNDGIFWINESFPDTELGSWLRSRGAFWVEQLDFDELMIRIWKEYDLGYAGDVVKSNADRICDSYRKAFEKLSERIEGKPESEDKEDLAEVAAAFIKSAPGWWGVHLEAWPLRKSDPDRADAIFREGVRKFDDSADLTASYAFFLQDYRRDYDRAEKQFRKAINLDPDDAFHATNLARFLEKTRKDYDEADQLYIKAIELDPKHAGITGNYAVFLKNVRKNYNKAEELFKKALELDPDHAINTGNYANFLCLIRKDYERAEELYKRAIELDPEYALNVCNYANFLCRVRKDYERSEELYKKAVELDPECALHVGNYGGFLLSRGENRGFDYIDKALSLSADDADPSAVVLLCHFNRYAHSTDDEMRNQSLNAVRSLLLDDVGTPRFNLSQNVRRAIQDGHPEPEFLEMLAKVIADEADISELDQFEVWRNAGRESSES